MNFKLLLLQITPDMYDAPLENMGDRISMVFDMLLRGVGTVFFVLALLWGILAIFSAVLHRGDVKTTAERKKEARPAPAKKEKPAPAVAAPAQTAEDTALIAAITAAVAAYLDQPTTSFRVVSFKRTGKKK